MPGNSQSPWYSSDCSGSGLTSGDLGSSSAQVTSGPHLVCQGLKHAVYVLYSMNYLPSPYIIIFFEKKYQGQNSNRQVGYLPHAAWLRLIWVHSRVPFALNVVLLTHQEWSLILEWWVLSGIAQQPKKGRVIFFVELKILFEGQLQTTTY